jgi:hypothetical protein
VINYCVSTSNRGLFIKPDGEMNNKNESEKIYTIQRYSDSEYAKDIQERQSISAYWDICYFIFNLFQKQDAEEFYTISGHNAMHTKNITCEKGHHLNEFENQPTYETQG